MKFGNPTCPRRGSRSPPPRSTGHRPVACRGGGGGEYEHDTLGQIVSLPAPSEVRALPGIIMLIALPRYNPGQVSQPGTDLARHQADRGAAHVDRVGDVVLVLGAIDGLN